MTTAQDIERARRDYVAAIGTEQEASARAELELLVKRAKAEQQKQRRA